MTVDVEVLLICYFTLALTELGTGVALYLALRREIRREGRAIREDIRREFRQGSA